MNRPLGLDRYRPLRQLPLAFALGLAGAFWVSGTPAGAAARRTGISW